MKASDLFVRQLEEEGVTHIFGLPGEENLDLLESLRRSRIRFILTRHEQAAAFMAATYGRLTGKAGVCLSTLGPGATNLMTGIAHAQFIGAPFISLSGQKPLQGNWQGRFQLLDVVNLMKPITKHSVTITDPDAIPTVLRTAFRIAEEERPGAVHVELPEDVASNEAAASIQKPGSVPRQRPNPAAIEKAAQMINKACNPLIILSGGANRKQMSEPISRFIKMTGIHAVHTQMGKGVLSDASEYSLFAAGIHKRDYVNCGIDRADLIIAIGYNITEYPPFVWNMSLDKQILSIDFVKAALDRYYNPEVELIGDIAYTLSELGEKVTEREDEEFKKIRGFLKKKLFNKFTSTYPPAPHEIVEEVRNALGRTDILALDNGIYKLWFARLYKTYASNTFLVDNALATMGAGLPAAIAAKLLSPEKKVLAVVGDGGFMMNSQELETALRYDIPVVVLILNDNAFGFIKWKQIIRGFEHFGVDYANPDFARYAESYGAVGIRLRKGDRLSDVLKKAFSLRKVTVIECPVDYSANYETFSRELENLVCEI